VPKTDIVTDNVSDYSSAVLALLGRAMLDESFRERLGRDPVQAASGYKLIGHELVYLRAIDRDYLEDLRAGLKAELARYTELAQAVASQIAAVAQAWEAQVEAIFPDEEVDPPGAGPEA
jgi:hypothetical protein